MDINLSKITTKGKCLLLAYDQGLEHGPTDFDDHNVNPEFIMKIARDGDYNGVVFQQGIAEKYWDGSVPLVLKLNGKTNLVKGDPFSPQLCSVDEAIELGACAVGYTIFVGSIHEPDMFKEFVEIHRQAHAKGIPVIAWMYPRGAAIHDENSKETLAYAARVGLELGADMIQLRYNGHVDDLAWAVKSAGKTQVVVAGGSKKIDRAFLHDVSEVMQAGAIGLAVGRNVWQHCEPMKMTNAIKKIVFEGKSCDEAVNELHV